MSELIPNISVERKILIIRGFKVMLDADLAEMYGVPTKVLNQQVKRNLKRFPADFMFQLTKTEVEILRSQIVTLRLGHGKHSKYLPFVFTEQGVAMLSSVISTERAILVNIEIVRAFVRLRQILATNKDLARKLETLEKRVGAQDTALAGMPYPYQGLELNNDGVVDKLWADSLMDTGSDMEPAQPNRVAPLSGTGQLEASQQVKAGVSLGDHFWSIGKVAFQRQSRSDLEAGLKTLPVTVFVASASEWDRAMKARTNVANSFRPRLRKVVLSL